jgi:hypothetical protein
VFPYQFKYLFAIVQNMIIMRHKKINHYSQSTHDIACALCLSCDFVRPIDVFIVSRTCKSTWSTLREKRSFHMHNMWNYVIMRIGTAYFPDDPSCADLTSRLFDAALSDRTCFIRGALLLEYLLDEIYIIPPDVDSDMDFRVIDDVSLKSAADAMCQNVSCRMDENNQSSNIPPPLNGDDLPGVRYIIQLTARTWKWKTKMSYPSPRLCLMVRILTRIKGIHRGQYVMIAKPMSRKDENDKYAHRIAQMHLEPCERTKNVSIYPNIYYDANLIRINGEFHFMATGLVGIAKKEMNNHNQNGWRPVRVRARLNHWGFNTKDNGGTCWSCVIWSIIGVAFVIFVLCLSTNILCYF